MENQQFHPNPLDTGGTPEHPRPYNAALLDQFLKDMDKKHPRDRGIPSLYNKKTSEEFAALVRRNSAAKKDLEDYQQFLDQLLHEKERFRAVFRTDRGSYYFLTADDVALRFKCVGAKWYAPDEDRSEKTWFMTEEAFNGLGNIRLSELIGQELTLTPLATGVIPFELGRAPHSRWKYTFDRNKLTIHSFQMQDRYNIWNDRPPNVHPGHNVSEILHQAP